MTSKSDKPRRTVLAALLVLTALAVAGCQSTAERHTAPAGNTAANKQTLVVGTAASAAPLVFRQEDKSLAGLEIDLARELARRLDRKPRIVSMFFPNLPFELREQRIDIIMAGMSVTDERRLEMAFTTPYLQSGQQAMVHRDDAQRLRSITAMQSASARIGVEKGSTGAAYAADTFGRPAVHEYATLADAAESLRRRQVDVVIHDHPSVTWLIHHDRTDALRAVPGLLTSESIAWAVAPENTDLLSQADAALDQMRADGTLDRLIGKWIRGQ